MTKRIVSLQDISCVGQCSLTVALPIISACGVETAILPSAILSTHTGGFQGFTFRDLTEDIPSILSHWKKEGLRFDALYTGYLGSAEQIRLVEQMDPALFNEGAPFIMDPAMADNGRLYAGFDEAFVREMARLCAKADVLLPNVTEACLMTGMPYREDFDDAYVDELLAKTASLGCDTVLLTGAFGQKEYSGIALWEKGVIRRYRHPRIAKGSHGTGDVFASAFVGALMRGKSVFDSACIAADFVLACIKETHKEENHWYGVRFESVLGELIRRLS